ncbi:hypothetical protein AB0I60_11190 [Actinosynnema sp. NPDC050436]|uniref:hypothetical protein n=1 Tax=Actinosynnema sp. NPDC050436 TaxID=3155659 RepID=UPI0033F2F40D
MEANLFSLVPESDPSLVFAWGMEIEDDDHTEAVLYRRDPATGRSLVAQHTCAEAARRRWGLLVPLRLVWEFEDSVFPVTGATDRG